MMGGQIRPGVPLKQQKENENSGECRKKTNENRDERNQDSRVASTHSVSSRVTRISPLSR